MSWTTLGLGESRIVAAGRTHGGSAGASAWDRAFPVETSVGLSRGRRCQSAGLSNGHVLSM